MKSIEHSTSSKVNKWLWKWNKNLSKRVVILTLKVKISNFGNPTVENLKILLDLWQINIFISIALKEKKKWQTEDSLTASQHTSNYL